ncbi:MAG TPA: NUDIX hydrolase [Gemmatimonadales bacterium]|nr:NUDIX hydrolase [Gemmatimonadales bacterium]
MPFLSTQRIHTGKVLNLDIDTVEFPDGSTGTLEMIRHPGASAVLPFLDDPGEPDPRALLIRQFRHAADGDIWEIPAGRLDPGEEPVDCAHRELAEETGYAATTIEPLISVFTTPGFTDEVIHLFVATGLTAGTPRREADEFVETHELRWSEVLRLVQSGEIRDGKTLAAILYLQAFRR